MFQVPFTKMITVFTKITLLHMYTIYKFKRYFFAIIALKFGCELVFYEIL